MISLSNPGSSREREKRERERERERERGRRDCCNHQKGVSGGSLDCMEFCADLSFVSNQSEKTMPGQHFLSQLTRAGLFHLNPWTGHFKVTG